jgi:hypothetical protein
VRLLRRGDHFVFTLCFWGNLLCAALVVCGWKTRRAKTLIKKEGAVWLGQG